MRLLRSARNDWMVMDTIFWENLLGLFVMQLIAHRRNTISELDETPAEYGVEIDLRSRGNRLILHHEPFADGVDFEEWLKHYRHKTLILNIKEEGIEYRVQELVRKRGIGDYFFLDLSFPALVKMLNQGERRIAVRFSEYESIETALALAGKIDWVWIDCFSIMPLTESAYNLLAKHFKLCLVSPELLGRDVEIGEYKKMLASFQIDAVCTKKCDVWRSLTSGSTGILPVHHRLEACAAGVEALASSASYRMNVRRDGTKGHTPRGK